MKLVKSLAILLLVFVAGLVVGGWSSEIVRIVKVWLQLQDRLLANQGSTIAQGLLSSGKRWEMRVSLCSARLRPGGEGGELRDVDERHAEAARRGEHVIDVVLTFARTSPVYGVSLTKIQPISLAGG
jgi:hypothetical protein